MTRRDPRPLRARVARLEAHGHGDLLEISGMLRALDEATRVVVEGGPVDPDLLPLVERWAAREPDPSMMGRAAWVYCRAALAGKTLGDLYPEDGGP